MPSLLSSFGGPSFDGALADFLQAPDPRVLLDALTRPGPLGDPTADPRDLRDDLERAMMAVAERVPVPFMEAVRGDEALLGQAVVLRGVSVVPGPEATALLAGALSSRAASLRWQALEALDRRGDEVLLDHLSALLVDRDGLVAYQALGVALRRGRADHLPALVKALSRMPPSSGLVLSVMDAMEAIALRTGADLPPDFPRRLRRVTLPPDVRLVRGGEGALFPRGAPVGQGPQGDWPAPESWYVVVIWGDGLLVRDPEDGRRWSCPPPPPKRRSRPGAQ